jgi:hypothetical protein
MRSFNQLLFVAGLSLLFVCTVSTTTANGQSPKIFFIDALVASSIETIDGASATDKILNLPDSGNPLAIIANELKTRTYSEVHLFVLTKPGSLIFDEVNILAGNVDDYDSFFAEWKKNLTPGAKIIIHYGVLTSEPDGMTLIERMSELTGVTVIVQN